MNSKMFWAIILSFAIPSVAWAQDSITSPVPQTAVRPFVDNAKNYVAQIQLHTPEELESLLSRVDEYVEKGVKFPSDDPIAVILHGPELQVFDRKNYQKYKHIVSMAARLEAFNVIDVRVCEVQIQLDGVNRGDLPAFVDSVPYGPAEVDRLLKKGYEYF